MKSFSSCLLLACIMSACSPASDLPPAAPLTGADRDTHGCIASAGYTWSPVRGACIRLFESGLAFLPDPAPAQGAVLAAYVVLAPVQGDAVSAAELFLPGRATPIALSVARTVAGPEGHGPSAVLFNLEEGVRVMREQGAHVLEVKGQRYRRQSEAADPLFLIR